MCSVYSVINDYGIFLSIMDHTGEVFHNHQQQLNVLLNLLSIFIYTQIYVIRIYLWYGFICIKFWPLSRWIYTHFNSVSVIY